jgi:hypothetical protein
LERARVTAPDRPEAYFNAGLFQQEYESRHGAYVPALREAAVQYQAFLTRSGDDPQFERSRGLARERLEEVRALMAVAKEWPGDVPSPLGAPVNR